jgi:hypothetical protein
LYIAAFARINELKGVKDGIFNVWALKPMSWKNIAQTSLSDALLRHHEALAELDGSCPGHLLKSRADKRGRRS